MFVISVFGFSPTSQLFDSQKKFHGKAVLDFGYIALAFSFSIQPNRSSVAIPLRLPAHVRVFLFSRFCWILCYWKRSFRRVELRLMKLNIVFSSFCFDSFGFIPFGWWCRCIYLYMALNYVLWIVHCTGCRRCGSVSKIQCVHTGHPIIIISAWSVRRRDTMETICMYAMLRLPAKILISNLKCKRGDGDERGRFTIDLQIKFERCFFRQLW